MDTLHKLAILAGAAKFYPEQQSIKEDNYLVSRHFLERFAQGITTTAFNEGYRACKLEIELDHSTTLKKGTGPYA